MFSLYAHVACLSHELCFQCGSHICPVIYVKYVHNVAYSMIDACDFICDTYVYTFPICTCQIFGILDQFDGYICFWHIFGNNI